MNAKHITKNISVNVQSDTTDRYICELSVDFEVPELETIHSEGGSEEHAIAIALEQLATYYRQAAEAQQNVDWEAVEESAEGEAIAKKFHVILHYEQLAEEVSKFEAMHNTIMGNTVVENAQISVIEVGQDVQIEPLARSWDY